VFTITNAPACQRGQDQCIAWIARQPLRQHVVYQPASRYWTFQFLETASWLVLAVGLAGLCLGRLKSV
jgi:hypothetical protein